MKLPILYSKSSAFERKQARIMYANLQKGKCYFCNKSLDAAPEMDIPINWELFPKDFLKHPKHLHHSHETDLTLGTVHAYCNAILWQYHGE